MYRDNARSKSFTRRTALVAGGQLALFGVLAGRLYQLQVLDSNRYKLLAEENRIHLRLLPPPRGRVLDRYGEPMAVNRDNYRLLLVPEQASDVVALLDDIGELVPLADWERRRVLREVQRRRGFVPVTARENLTWNEVSRVEVNAPDLPGVSIDVGQTREYPQGPTAAHILGYVAAVSEKEQADDPLLSLPGFRIGKSGVEKVRDLDLRGKAGTSQLEVNAVGRVIRELSREEGQPGNDVTLTIDMALQTQAMKLLSNVESGSAALVDIHSGQVLALASAPGFDPNAFARGLTNSEWHELTTDHRAPLTNKAIAGTYSPGSTFKTVVALAAMEAGISPEHTVFCRGVTRLGNARFHCWKRWGHGKLSMVDAIGQSCDIYFYDIARRIGIDRIAAMARRLGLGDELGIDIPGEKAGLIPTRRWKKKAIGVPWQQGETLVAGIGQGFVLTTPLQLAVMTARIANGGKAVVPHLIHTPEGGENAKEDDNEHKRTDTAPPFKPLGISTAALDIVRQGMWEVSNGKHGTARRARIAEEGMEMAGKTGTSQVRRITKRERETRVLKNEELPWRQRDHALFIGFAPFDRPRYAVSVVVEHGGGGSKVAAPIARDLLLAVQKRSPGRIGDGQVAEGGKGSDSRRGDNKERRG